MAKYAATSAANAAGLDTTVSCSDSRSRAVVGAVALVVGRGTVLVGAAASGALAGSVAGLAAAMCLHLHCAAFELGHLAIVHVLPLVCAIIAGALAGRRILAV